MLVPHPGSDDAWYCATVLLIYQTMNFSERASCMWSRSSSSLLRVLCGKNEDVCSAARRAKLVVRKKLRMHSHLPTFQVCAAICILRRNHVSFRSLARYVSFTDLRFYSTLEDR